MPLDEAIRKRGFRRWYERELYASYAHLVTGFLSLIMMAIAIEMLEFRDSAAGWLALVAIAVAGGGLCVFTWRQFTWLLFRAEYMAEHATCAHCRAYARFDLLAATQMAEAPAGCTLDVRCRNCGHEWRIA